MSYVNKNINIRVPPLWWGSELGSRSGSKPGSGSGSGSGSG